MVLSRFYQLLRSNEYYRRAGTLSKSGFVRPVLNLAVLPILLILYQPEAFGVLLIAMSWSVLIGGSATLSYERAIMATESASEARSVAMLAVLVAALVMFLLWFCAVWLEFLTLSDYTWAVIILFSASTIFHGVLVQTQNTKMMSRIRLVQGIAEPLLAVLIGLTAPVVEGLLFAHIGGLTLVCAIGFWQSKLWHAQWSELRALLVQYRRYPVWTFPGSILNRSAIHGAPLVLGGLFGSELVGYLAIAQRVVGTPLFVVSIALTDTFNGLFPKKNREQRLQLITNHFKVLGPVGLIVSVGLVVVASIGFQLDILAKWEAAMMVLWLMAPLYLVQFLVSPTSGALHLLGANSLQFVWEALRFFALLILAFVVTQWATWGYGLVLVWYVAVMVVSYVVLSVMVVQKVRSTP